jgi:hypothetical protein
MSKGRIDALIEAAEAEFMYQYETMAAPPTKTALGIATTRIGGGVALSMRNDVTGYWSKALGFGFTEPVTSGLIAQVVEFYRGEQSAGAVLQIAPAVLPPDWEEVCCRHNIRPASPWIKLACGIDDLLPGHTTLRVAGIGPASVREWASVTLRGFGMPEHDLIDMFMASVDHPDFRPFAARDGDEIVATANVFIHGEVGVVELCSDAAQPPKSWRTVSADRRARRRGRQSRLPLASRRDP